MKWDLKTFLNRSPFKNVCQVGRGGRRKKSESDSESVRFAGIRRRCFTSSYFLSASSAICLAWANWASRTAILSSSILALFSRTLRILNETGWRLSKTFRRHERATKRWFLPKLVPIGSLKRFSVKKGEGQLSKKGLMADYPFCALIWWRWRWVRVSANNQDIKLIPCLQKSNKFRFSIFGAMVFLRTSNLFLFSRSKLTCRRNLRTAVKSKADDSKNKNCCSWEEFFWFVSTFLRLSFFNRVWNEKLSNDWMILYFADISSNLNGYYNNFCWFTV